MRCASCCASQCREQRSADRIANTPADGLCGGDVRRAGAFQDGSTSIRRRGRRRGRRLGLVCNIYFVTAVVFYAGYAILWVWILSFTPLSRAYPFVALAFALTPLLGAMLFGETISLRLIVGLLF